MKRSLNKIAVFWGGYRIISPPSYISIDSRHSRAATKLARPFACSRRKVSFGRVSGYDRGGSVAQQQFRCSASGERRGREMEDRRRSERGVMKEYLLQTVSVNTQSPFRGGLAKLPAPAQGPPENQPDRGGGGTHMAWERGLDAASKAVEGRVTRRAGRNNVRQRGGVH